MVFGRHGMSVGICGTRRGPVLLGLDAAGFLSDSVSAAEAI